MALTIRNPRAKNLAKELAAYRHITRRTELVAQLTEALTEATES